MAILGHETPVRKCTINPSQPPFNGDLQAAVDTGFPVEITGKWVHEGDLIIRNQGQSFFGCGANTDLTINNGGLILDGQSANSTAIPDFYLHYPTIGRFTLRRTGSVGPAFHIRGWDGISAQRSDVVRWVVDPIWIEESTGDGILIENSYLGDIYSPFVRNTQGMAWSVQFGNDINVFGGETQQNQDSGELRRCAGFRFNGHSIEGNMQGIRILGSTSTTITDGYFEFNRGDYDVQIGDADEITNQSCGLVNCRFTRGAALPTNIPAVKWIKSVHGYARDCWYSDHYDHPHSVTEKIFLVENTVSHESYQSAQNNATGNWIDAPSPVDGNGTLGLYTSSPIRFRKNVPAISVGANQSIDTVINYTPLNRFPVQAGSNVVVVNGPDPSGVHRYVFVSNIGQITIRHTNPTGVLVIIPAFSYTMDLYPV